jgi:hypothetical protein
MVEDPGTPARPPALRPLGDPHPATLLTRPGPDGAPVPTALLVAGQRVAVTRIDDVWAVEDEWWRAQPISRRYYRLALADGAVRVVYHDGGEDAWYAQAY